MDRRESVAGGEEPKDQQLTTRATEPSSPPEQKTRSPDRLKPHQDLYPASVDATPGTDSRSGSEDLTKKLLAAYQGTLDTAEDLSAVVWVRWDSDGLGRFLKVPYLRWFLRYYLVHHIRRSVNTLSRRLQAIAALADDPGANKANREAVDLYLRSLPPLPYKTMIFAAIIAALLLALPLASFGNVLDVLPLVGATLRFDVYYVVRLLQGQELDDTVRAAMVLLLALSVVASVLNSPFELKRILFNLYPATRERVASAAARDNVHSVEGLYALEERVFREVGLRRPKEGRWDLLFRTFVLMILLLLSAGLGFVALIIGLSWNVTFKYTTDAPANVNISLPQVHWVFFALPAFFSLIAFVIGLRRLVIAWQIRRQPARD